MRTLRQRTMIGNTSLCIQKKQLRGKIREKQSIKHKNYAKLQYLIYPPMINTKQNPKEYIVKDIIGFGWLNNHRVFKIHWKNYPLTKASWQPEINLGNAREKCNQYYESLSKQEKANRLEDLNLHDIEDILIAIKGKTPEPRAPSTPKTKDLATPLKKKKIKKHQLPQQPRTPPSLMRSPPSETARKPPSISSQSHNRDLFSTPTKEIAVTRPKEIQLGYRNQQGVIELLVSWEPDRNGYQRPDEFVLKDDVMRKWPEKLMEFYDQSIRWI